MFSVSFDSSVPLLTPRREPGASAWPVDRGWDQARYCQTTQKAARRRTGEKSEWLFKARTLRRQRQASTSKARFFPHDCPDGRLCASRATTRLFQAHGALLARSTSSQRQSRSRSPPKSLPPSVAGPNSWPPLATRVDACRWASSGKVAF